MPVNTPSKIYTGLFTQWGRARAVVRGREAIIDGGDEFAARPSGMADDEFKSYLSRGSWYGATRRTIDGMSGLIFRRPATIELPPGQEYLVEVAAKNGTSLAELADKMVDEILAVGRYGLLVDFPRIDLAIPRTVAQAEGSGERPYLATYMAEAIINWRWRVMKSKRMLDRVILQEVEAKPDPDDPFVEIETIIYRELGLDDAGNYFQRVWELDAAGKDYIAREQFYPQIGGAPMKAIPFWCATVVGDDIDNDHLPLADLIELNIAHWRNSVDFEHGLHFTGCPTPVITGYSAQQGEKITIGSETCLILDNPSAGAFYLEFGGAGLSTNITAMAEKKVEMATVGSRLLMDDPNGIESAQTAAIHRSGENSVLASIAQATSKILTRAYKVMVEWAGGNPETAMIQLNTDFLPFQMSAQMIGALVAAQQAGVFSKQTLFTKLQEGEIIPAGVLFDEDMVRILAEDALGLPNVNRGEGDEEDEGEEEGER